MRVCVALVALLGLLAPPAAGYEKVTRWLGYPVTFLYVALGYAFVATADFEQALKILYNVFRLPLAWLVGVVT